MTGHQAKKILMQALGKFPKYITKIFEGREVLIPSSETDFRDSEDASVRSSPVRCTGECLLLSQADTASI